MADNENGRTAERLDYLISMIVVLDNAWSKADWTPASCDPSVDQTPHSHYVAGRGKETGYGQPGGCLAGFRAEARSFP